MNDTETALSTCNDLNAYQKEALRTASRSSNWSDLEHLKCWALGLAGETGEFARLVNDAFYCPRPHDVDTVEGIKELGDVTWYSAVAARALGRDLSAVAPHCDGTWDDWQRVVLSTFSPRTVLRSPYQVTTFALGMVSDATDFADHVKKHAYHHHELVPERLVLNLRGILFDVNVLAHALGVKTSEVVRRNVLKLRMRYPDGFSPEASRARADETSK